MKIIRRPNGEYTPMRSIFDDFFTVPSLVDEMFGKSLSTKNLFADIWEEDDSYTIKMAIPGVSKEDISISTSNDSVTIKAESKNVDEEDSKKKYYCRTMETSYEQTFNLPTKVDSDKADAQYQNGVLTLKLPKASDIQLKKISVN